MKLLHFFKIYGSLIALTISGLLSTIGGNLFTSQYDKDGSYWNDYAFILLVGIFLFVVGSVESFRRTKSYEKNIRLLEQKDGELGEVSAQNKKLYTKMFITLYDILKRYLAYTVYNELNEVITPSERMTIYAHDSEAMGFRQIGRYSPNPKYDRRSTVREFYPESQGSIGIAWTRGLCEIVVSDPIKDFEAYKYELITKYHFTEEIVGVISMPSRVFMGYAIEDSQKNKIGVILFESTELNRLKRNKALLQAVASDKHHVIQTMIEKENELRRLFPYKY